MCVKADTSVSVGWQEYEQHIVGQQQSKTVEPVEWSVGLSWLSEDNWMLSGNFSNGAWQGDWDSQTSLTIDTEAAGISLSWFDQAWTQSLGFQFAEYQLQGEQNTSANSVSETSRSREWYASLSYDALWGRFWFSPALTLAWQDSEVVQASTLDFRNNRIVSFSRTQESDGSYAQLGLYFATEFGQSAWLFTPYISASWSEVLSGSVVTTRPGRGRAITSTEVSEDERDGSGIVVLGLTMLVDAFSLDVSVSDTVNDDAYGRAIAVLLGVGF